MKKETIKFYIIERQMSETDKMKRRIRRSELKQRAKRQFEFSVYESV